MHRQRLRVLNNHTFFDWRVLAANAEARCREDSELNTTETKRNGFYLLALSVKSEGVAVKSEGVGQGSVNSIDSAEEPI